jgi:hypothetical protein
MFHSVEVFSLAYMTNEAAIINVCGTRNTQYRVSIHVLCNLFLCLISNFYWAKCVHCLCPHAYQQEHICSYKQLYFSLSSSWIELQLFINLLLKYQAIPPWWLTESFVDFTVAVNMKTNETKKLCTNFFNFSIFLKSSVN